MIAAADRKRHTDTAGTETHMRCHDARVLTDGSDTAQVVLDDQIYILRITRAGKLILTK